MQGLESKRVLLGITGGIAAYKSAEICRRLKDAGAEVQVIMTEGGTRFVTPLTFQALTGRPVRTDLLDPAAEAAMGHIELAKWADLVVVAPASADFMARLAAGMADDLLATACLATEAPIAVAPAMNQAMWASPATQRNCATLHADGVQIWGPASGAQACGDVGAGRMLEPADLLECIHTALGAAPVAGEAARPGDSPSVVALHEATTGEHPIVESPPVDLSSTAENPVVQLRSADTDEHPIIPRGQSLAGRHVVLTAGPTREAIDPVRYISNHSSGKQGYALAAAAARAGARVTLVSGPVELATPEGVDRVDVVSAREMLKAAEAAIGDADVFIGVAAVADFRVDEVAEHKIKKNHQHDGLELHLVANPDIVATMTARRNRPFSVAFAAETRDVVENARGKLQRKHVDLVIANDVSDTSIGFGSDENLVLLVDAHGEEALPKMPKDALAAELIERIAQRLVEREAV